MDTKQFDLLIANFNINTKTFIAGQVNYNVNNHPLTEINKQCPPAEMFQVTGWKTSDVVVCVYCLSGITEPVGFVVKTIVGDDKWHSNDDYIVTMKTIKVNNESEQSSFTLLNTITQTSTEHRLDDFKVFKEN